MYIKTQLKCIKSLKKKPIYGYLLQVFKMPNLRLLGNIFYLQILLGNGQALLETLTSPSGGIRLILAVVSHHHPLSPPAQSKLNIHKNIQIAPEKNHEFWMLPILKLLDGIKLWKPLKMLSNTVKLF